MGRDAWLSRHPYLRPLADLCDRAEAAAAGVEMGSAAVPSWDDYLADYIDGVPLLSSAGAEVDLEPAGRAVVRMVEHLAAAKLPPKVAAEAVQLRNEDLSSRVVVDWLLGDGSLEPSAPGLLRFLGWTAMARYLQPVVDAFGGWRNEEHWQRRYCPTCGSLPAMAQLVGVDAGRKRLLACGRCRTRWQYNRTRCPFCEDDTQRISVVTVSGEEGLRIDHCESCKGYLKTYAGQGDEALLLADWSSLHLDLLAQDRGLKRMAASLYELGAGAGE